MKGLFRLASFLLFFLAVVDFVLVKFIEINITGHSWTSGVFFLGAAVLQLVNTHLLKPKGLELGDDSITKYVSLYGVLDKDDGKLYITRKKMVFDGGKTPITIDYNEIKTIEKTKVLSMINCIEITMNNEESYVFGVLSGRDELLETIQKYKNENG